MLVSEKNYTSNRNKEKSRMYNPEVNTHKSHYSYQLSKVNWLLANLIINKKQNTNKTQVAINE